MAKICQVIATVRFVDRIMQTRLCQGIAPKGMVLLTVKGYSYDAPG